MTFWTLFRCTTLCWKLMITVRAFPMYHRLLLSVSIITQRNTISVCYTTTTHHLLSPFAQAYLRYATLLLVSLLQIYNQKNADVLYIATHQIFFPSVLKAPLLYNITLNTICQPKGHTDSNIYLQLAQCENPEHTNPLAWTTSLISLLWFLPIFLRRNPVSFIILYTGVFDMHSILHISHTPTFAFSIRAILSFLVSSTIKHLYYSTSITLCQVAFVPIWLTDISRYAII